MSWKSSAGRFKDCRQAADWDLLGDAATKRELNLFSPWTSCALCSPSGWAAGQEVVSWVRAD
jgi:hypothetical protein